MRTGLGLGVSYRILRTSRNRRLAVRGLCRQRFTMPRALLPLVTPPGRPESQSPLFPTLPPHKTLPAPSPPGLEVRIVTVFRE